MNKNYSAWLYNCLLAIIVRIIKMIIRYKVNYLESIIFNFVFAKNQIAMNAIAVVEKYIVTI